MDHQVKDSSAARPFAAFQIVPFRWVWFAALTANSGRYAVVLVAGWEAYRLGHHSSFWPSLVSFFILVPSMLIGLLGGSLADRFNRSRLASLGQTTNGLSCVIAGLLALSGRLNLVTLLAATAIIGVGNAIQGPAWQALVPSIVGPERLLNASMATRIAQQGSGLTGPAIGTAVLTAAGPGATYFLCAAFYVGGALLMARVRHAAAIQNTSKSTSASPGVFHQISDGMRYVATESTLPTLFIWVTLHCCLTMASIGILPAVASHNLHGNSGAYGILLSAFGAGSVAGPLMVILWVRRSTIPTLLISGFLSGLPLMSLGLIHSLPFAVFSSVLAGAGQAVFMAGIYSATQAVAANHMRGRVASIQLSLTSGTMGLTSIGWGALAAVLSPGVVLAIPGMAFTLCCVPFLVRRSAIGASLEESRTPGGVVAPAST